MKIRNKCSPVRNLSSSHHKYKEKKDDGGLRVICQSDSFENRTMSESPPLQAALC